MKFKLHFLLFAVAATVFVQCKDDAYYERPSWLEPSTYDVLKNDGNFSNYLAALDRTSYAAVLKGAGLYTVFAPNDNAFKTWLSGNGYQSVADVPADQIERIVAYSIVYSSVPFDSIGVRQHFKYKTNLYALPYEDPEYNNAWVFDQTGDNSVSSGQRNYKYLPTYTQTFFNSFATPLTAADYNAIYPESQFTGKNVQAGTVLRQDIRTENGYVHEVSTVNVPLDNLDELLKKQEYSGYKALMDMKNSTGDYLFKAYSQITDQQSLSELKKLVPMQQDGISSMYFKFISGTTLSTILENIYESATGSYNPEGNGYTLLVPTNEALQNYLQARVMRTYYKTADEVPVEALSALINAHMVENMVWTSSYPATKNGNEDFVNGEGASGKSFGEASILKKIPASNGLLYQTADVVKSSLFETVYSEIFLNPAHKLLDAAYLKYYPSDLRKQLMHCILNGYPSERYTMLNFTDQMLSQDGFTYNAYTSPPSFTLSQANINADTRITRLMRSHIFPGLNNNDINSEISDFAKPGMSQYGGWNFAVNYYGDAVRYKNDQMQAAGNIEDGTAVNLVKLDETFINGTVWNIDRMLQYSPRESRTGEEAFTEFTLWQYLNRARIQNPNVSMFVDYIEKCLKRATDSDDLDGINKEVFYTVLMPNNTAINSAIQAGVIKSIDQVSSTNPDALAQATKFVNSHFLVGKVIVDDGTNYVNASNILEPNRALLPLLMKINSDALGLINQSVFVEISKNASGMVNFVPQNVTAGEKTLVSGSVGGTSVMRIQRGAVVGSTVPDNYRSNRIACKAILHESNGYFVFTENN